MDDVVADDEGHSVKADYMAGGCHIFATALHRAYGFGYLLLVDEAETYPSGVSGVHHVYAVDAEGYAYDACGKHSVEDVVAQWSCSEDESEMEPGTERLDEESELLKYVSDDWNSPLTAFTDADVETALKTALDLLAAVLPLRDDPALRSF